jgi:alkylresorcinol/alkylpyrone synthase
VVRLLELSGVERRYSIMSPEEIFSIRSFADRNALFIERMLPLTERCLHHALEKAGMHARELDAIITTSCTGIMIPAIDAFLIDRVGLRGDILRLPVFQMGCAGGVAGLGYANAMMRAGAVKRVAVLAFESPTTTLRTHDFSMANLVSAAIFGDGVACVVLSNQPTKCSSPRPVLIDHAMYHFKDEQALMGFKLTDTGLEMVLSERVPEVIDAHLEAAVLPILSRNGYSPSQIDHFLFHPGGRRILASVDAWLQKSGKALGASHDVLRDFGNMSSATVLFVLARALEEPHRTGELGLMLSFGPGFSAQSLLLEWSAG